MSRIKKITHVVVAVVLAAAAGGLAWYYVKINTPGVNVVVAAETISIGTAIEPRHIVLKDYPQSVVPEDAEKSVQNVAGKTVISGTVFKGEVIRRGHTAVDRGSLKSLLGSMAPGREAIDLPAETSPGLKGIGVGERVNVYTELAVRQGKEPVTVVDCAATGAVILKVPPAPPGKDGIAAPTACKGCYVIAVTPEEAKKVSEGIVRGKKFSLSLLPPGEGGGAR